MMEMCLLLDVEKVIKDVNTKRSNPTNIFTGAKLQTNLSKFSVLIGALPMQILLIFFC